MYTGYIGVSDSSCVTECSGVRSSMSQSMCHMKFPFENSPTFAPSLLRYHAPSKSCGSNDEWIAKCAMADSGIMMSSELLVVWLNTIESGMTGMYEFDINDFTERNVIPWFPGSSIG